MKPAPTIALAVAISVVLNGLALGVYERLVRAPRTPQIAMVDLTKVMQLGRKRYETLVVSPSSTDEQKRAAVEDSAKFSATVRDAMDALGTECHCTLIGLPAVFGNATNMPDYTDLLRERLGL